MEQVQELVAEEEWVQRRVEVEVQGQVEEDSSAVELVNERFLFALHRMERSSTLTKILAGAVTGAYLQAAKGIKKPEPVKFGSGDSGAIEDWSEVTVLGFL